MFERNRVENVREQSAATVVVERDDGTTTPGRILFPRGKSLIEVLNGPTQFVEFQHLDGDGQPELLAKTAIRSLRIVSPPAARLPNPVTSATFDPYGVLGLSRGADRASLRMAYHEVSKRYHPDRYAGAELPDEITDYLEAMARRVNAAYELLSVELETREQIQAARTQPVYERGRPAA